MTKGKKEKEKEDKRLQEIIKKILSEQDNFVGLLDTSVETSELYEVIGRLMGGDEGIELKTEIHKPKKLAVLTVVKDFCLDNGLEITSKYLENFRVDYLKNMVSYKRAGREEVVEVLKNQDELGKQEIEVVE